MASSEDVRELFKDPNLSILGSGIFEPKKTLRVFLDHKVNEGIGEPFSIS